MPVARLVVLADAASPLDRRTIDAIEFARSHIESHRTGNGAVEGAQPLERDPGRDDGGRPRIVVRPTVAATVDDHAPWAF